MPAPSRPRRLLAAALLAGAALAAAQPVEERAAAEADAKRRLEAVREAQRTLVAEREAASANRGELARELREADLGLARLATAVRGLDTAIAAREVEIADLDARERRLAERLADQREALAALLRSRHAQGRHGELRLLLAPEAVATLTRRLAYLEVLQRARGARVRAALDDLADLARVRTALAAARDALAAQRAERGTEIARLEAERAAGRTRLREIERSLDDLAARRAALGKDERELLALLEKLRDAIADVPAVLAGAEPLAQRRGRLAWPVEGKVLLGFGVAAADGRTSTGVLIGAPPGTAVRAVAHGRVAYADWLKGFGLIAILDHGDGFLTLYGHNETLLAETGDWVEAGTPIATAGTSGGARESGVYFELRRAGRPLDPKPWLSRR